MTGLCVVSILTRYEIVPFSPLVTKRSKIIPLFRCYSRWARTAPVRDGASGPEGALARYASIGDFFQGVVRTRDDDLYLLQPAAE